MVLCQEKFLMGKLCINSLLPQRIDELNRFTARYDNRYTEKLASIIGEHYDESKSLEIHFLLKVLTLIEDNIHLIEDSKLKNNISKICESFYKNHFAIIMKGCQ